MDPARELTWLLVQPLTAAPVIYLAGRLSVRRGHGAGPARWLAVLAMLHLGWLLYTTGQHVLTQGPILLTIGQVALQMDGVSLLLAMTVLGLTFLVTIFSMPYMAGETGEEKYYALLTAMIGTMIGLGCAHDLFNLWVWFEAMAITSYMLVAFYREQRGVARGRREVPGAVAPSARCWCCSASRSCSAMTGTLELDADPGRDTEQQPGDARRWCVVPRSASA